MTVTTDDEDVRRTFEPSRPSNSVRLRAIAEVRAAGIDACVTMTPLLLVGQPNGFADSLIETGLENFIVQPFHFSKGKFIASTREPAVELMAQKLGCNPGSIRGRYMAHYKGVFRTLKSRLPSLGEGREGFAPPF